jgi:hypothetical protein
MLRELHWSGTEKASARKAFNKALEHELHALIGEAKERAAQVQEASQLWKLERWLSDRRSEIDRKYDYRYSVLPLVLANLLREGWISEGDLQGLDPEKLALIRGICSL